MRSSSHRLKAINRASDFEEKTNIAFFLFILYLVSFFLHLPSRITILGHIRFDFILVALISFLIISSNPKEKKHIDNASKYLLAIFCYAIISVPLVEWPGSVLKSGIVEFIKAAIFYFFTVSLVCNEARFRLVIIVFVVCNFIRVVEPLYLNITDGYLGGVTHLGDGEFAGRLSGAPSDVVNPNGLAFIIATIFPFMHYVFAQSSKSAFTIYLILVPILLYTMGLTLSRSGLLALFIIGVGIWAKSIRKIRLLIFAIIGLILVGTSLSEIQKDRYLSIISDDARQSATAEGRIEGWSEDFEVALNRPIVGHGLGTSREANWNFSGRDQISHILWAEIWQEIGLIGLTFFLLYLFAMIKNFREAGVLIKQHLPPNDFLYRANEAMQVWLLMNLLFSLASYGLKSYEWYFFGGLSVVMLKFVKEKVTRENALTAKEDFEVQSDRFKLARRLR
ncbi:O-antigen ligase family protein [Marinobacter sp.]|uniref:O-antigen ligase family protein n=1 Tax=Marinobacter sp. TaxID=50741 RepID=UPI002B2771A3|nr:O-antigen ligase family protein [Marinobacter sp.]